MFTKPKRSGGPRLRGDAAAAKGSSGGFTLLEVMVALAILALGLTAIVGINGNAIRSHGYAKRITVATMLARSKMADLESQFIKDGFTSDFDQKITGNFSDEGWNDFRWEAEIIKPDIDAANVRTLVENLVEQLSGDAENAVNAGTSAPVPIPDLGSMTSMMGPMIEGQINTLVELVKEKVREVRLKVIWKEGANEESLDVVTHLVVLAPAGQEGGASADPGADQALEDSERAIQEAAEAAGLEVPQ